VWRVGPEGNGDLSQVILYIINLTLRRFGVMPIAQLIR
jgi:hypothetical protein